MKIIGAAALGIVAIAAAAVLLVAFRREDASTPPTAARARIVSPTPGPRPTPTPLPGTWRDGLHMPQTAAPQLISCLDANHDGRIDGGDGASLQGLDIRLVAGEACKDPAAHADFFAGSPSDAATYTCAGGARPLLIVAVASAGSDLLKPSEGESMGLLDIVNDLQARAAAAGISDLPVLATSAVFGADQPQTAMEHWIEHDLAQRLAAMPCLRAVLIGHSHGGVAVTSVTAALDARFASRMFGVVLDRTTALYDRAATEMPTRTRLLNIFQMNEGWHGTAIGQANVTNVDVSHAAAPIAPSDGGGGEAIVTHKTLDDAPLVQSRVVEETMSWLGAR